MLPGPLAPNNPSKTRALTTIYAPRKLKPRNHKTAQSRMLENDIPVKTTMSPFHPLPAIGQKREKTKLIVFDFKNPKHQEILKPLTPLSIHGFKNNECDKKPLLRENTYDVIKPIYLTPEKIKNTPICKIRNDKASPKTRFRNAALQVAKLSMPETGKLLCLRERETYAICRDDSCRLQKLPQSPAQQLNKLSEIFQNLEMRGRYRDKMKVENSWF